MVKSADVLGGWPRVDGTRISVLQLARLAETGLSADEFVADLPILTVAQVYDALSNAADHPGKMARHEERQTLRAVLRAHELAMINHRLIPRHRLSEVELPPDATVYTWETLPAELER